MNDFEKAINENEAGTTYGTEVIENGIEWLKTSERATCTFCQKKLMSKIRELAKKYPDQCDIVVDDSKYIVAHFPVKWLKISNIKREFTEEQRNAARERMANARNNKKEAQ